MLLPLIALALESAHPHSDAVLVTAVEVAAPGRPFLAGLLMKIDPTWHTYWLNPGDSGIPLTIKWDLPPGWKAGPILWPTPKKLEMGGLVNYGYENEALFLTRITPPPNAKPGEMTLKGNAEWLICQQGCLPAKEAVQTRVALGTQEKQDAHWSRLLLAADSALPKKETRFQFAAVRDGQYVRLKVSGPIPANLGPIYFFPAEEIVEPAAKQTVEREDSLLTLTLKVSEFAPSNMTRLRGLLAAQKGANWGDNTEAIVVDTPIETHGR